MIHIPPQLPAEQRRRRLVGQVRQHLQRLLRAAVRRHRRKQRRVQGRKFKHPLFPRAGDLT